MPAFEDPPFAAPSAKPLTQAKSPAFATNKRARRGE